MSKEEAQRMVRLWIWQSYLYIGKFENLGSTVAKQVAEELDENLECIKKGEPVKNDLIWCDKLLEAEGQR